MRTSRIENELQVRERRRETNYERNVHSKYHMVFSPLILEIGPVLVPFEARAWKQHEETLKPATGCMASRVQHKAFAISIWFDS